MTENHLQTIVDDAPFALAHHEIILDSQNRPIDYRFIEVNKAYEKLTGLKAQDLIGKTFLEINSGLSPLDFDSIAQYGKIALEGGSDSFEQFSKAQGHWYTVTAYSTSKKFFTTAFTDLFYDKLQSNALESSLSGVLFTDKFGAFIYANAAFTQMFGFQNSEDCMKLTPFDIHPEEEHEKVKSSLEQLATSGFYKGELKAKKKTGQTFYVQLSVTSVQDSIGNLLCMMASFEDISERKRTEADLLLNKKIIGNISQVVIATGPDQLIVFVNESYTAITGYTANEILGRNCNFLVGPLTDPKASNQIWKALASKTQFSGAIQNHRKDGTPFWNDLSINPVFDTQGTLTHFVGLTKDITHRKQLEEGLNQALNIVKNIQVGLYIYHLEDLKDDRTLRLIYANPASEELTGFSVMNMIGKTIDEIFPNLRDLKVPERYAEVVRSGEVKVFEDIVYEDDRHIQASYSVKAFPLPNNQVGVCFDNVTDRARTLNQLNQTLLRLQEADTIGNTGSWDYNLITGKLLWSDQVYKIYCKTPEQFSVNMDSVMGCYPESDLKAVQEAFENALRQKKEFKIDHRIVTETGEIRHVQEIGKLIFPKLVNPFVWLD